MKRKFLTFWSGDLNPRFSVIFPPMIWIFMWSEELEIKSKQTFKRDRTLYECFLEIWVHFVPKSNSKIVKGLWTYQNLTFLFMNVLIFLLLLINSFICICWSLWFFQGGNSTTWLIMLQIEWEKIDFFVNNQIFHTLLSPWLCYLFKVYHGQA